MTGLSVSLSLTAWLLTQLLMAIKSKQIEHWAENRQSTLSSEENEGSK